MSPYLFRRLVLLVLTLFGASLVVFGLIRIIPGDLVTILLGVTASQNEATREALTRSLALDRPLTVQYLTWIAGVVRGDLGASLVTGLAIREEIVRSFPVTIQLLLMSFAIAVLLGVPTGVLAAVRPNGITDGLLRVGSVAFISTPAFFIGMLLILGSSYVPAIPTLVYTPFAEDPLGSLYTMLMPAVALGIAVSAIVLRFTRTAMLEVLGEDYVRTGRAKGLPQRRVMFRHALRNAAVPIVAVLGAQFIQLVGNMIVIEQVFGLPGIGQLLVNAIFRRDYTMIQGIVLVLILFSLFASLLLDLLFAAIDPRIRYT